MRRRVIKLDDNDGYFSLSGLHAKVGDVKNSKYTVVSGQKRFKVDVGHLERYDDCECCGENYGYSYTIDGVQLESR